MIPPFTEAGLLPPGIYRATQPEFVERFCWPEATAKRKELFAKIKILFSEARKFAAVQHFVFAGSIVTAKREPSDFDCLLVIDPAKVVDVLRPFEYNLVSKRMVRKLYQGDIFPVMVGSPNYERMMQFFQSTRDKIPVGIVEVFHGRE